METQTIEEEQPVHSQFEQRLNLKKWDEDENEIRNFLKKLQDELQQSFIQSRLDKVIKDDEIQCKKDQEFAKKERDEHNFELELAVKEIMNKEQQLNLSLELAYVLLEKMSEQREAFIDESESFQTQKEELEREIDFKDQYCGEYQRRLQYLTDQNGQLNKEFLNIEEQNEQLRGRNAALDQQLLKSLQHIETVKQVKDEDTNTKLTMIHKELENYKLHNAQLSKELFESKKRIQTELIQSQECFAAIDDLRRQLSVSQKEIDAAGRSVLELSLRLQSVQEEKDKLEADYFQLSMIHNRMPQGRESKEGIDFENNENNNYGTFNRGNQNNSPQVKTRKNNLDQIKQEFASQIDDQSHDQRSALFGELVDYQKDQGKKMMSGEDFFDFSRESTLDDKFKAKKSFMGKYKDKLDGLNSSIAPQQQQQNNINTGKEEEGQEQEINLQQFNSQIKQIQIDISGDKIEEEESNTKNKDSSQQQQLQLKTQQIKIIKNYGQINDEEEEEEEKKEIYEEPTIRINGIQNNQVENEEEKKNNLIIDENNGFNSKNNQDQQKEAKQTPHSKTVIQDEVQLSNLTQENTSPYQDKSQKEQVLDILLDINNTSSSTALVLNTNNNNNNNLSINNSLIRNGFMDSEIQLKKRNSIKSQRASSYRQMLTVLSEEDSGVKSNKDNSQDDIQNTSQFQVHNIQQQKQSKLHPKISSSNELRTPKVNGATVTFAEGCDDGNHQKSSDDLPYLSQSAIQPSQLSSAQRKFFYQQDRKAHRKTLFMENMKSYKNTHWGEHNRDYQFQSLMLNTPQIEENTSTNLIGRCPDCLKTFYPQNSFPLHAPTNTSDNKKTTPIQRNQHSSFIQLTADEDDSKFSAKVNLKKTKENTKSLQQQIQSEQNSSTIKKDQQTDQDTSSVIYFKSGLRNAYPQRNYSLQPNSHSEFHFADTPKNTLRVGFAKEEDDMIDNLPSSSKDEGLLSQQDTKELKQNYSMSTYARNPSTENISEGFSANNRRITGINKTQRKDPYEEFFMLTAQCVKLNSEFFDEIICLNMKPFYDEIKKLAIPYQKWSEYLTEKLNKIGKDMNQQNKQSKKFKINLDIGKSPVFISPIAERKTQSLLKS